MKPADIRKLFLAVIFAPIISFVSLGLFISWYSNYDTIEFIFGGIMMRPIVIPLYIIFVCFIYLMIKAIHGEFELGINEKEKKF